MMQKYSVYMLILLLPVRIHTTQPKKPLSKPALQKKVLIKKPAKPAGAALVKTPTIGSAQHAQARQKITTLKEQFYQALALHDFSQQSEKQLNAMIATMRKLDAPTAAQLQKNLDQAHRVNIAQTQFAHLAKQPVSDATINAMKALADSMKKLNPSVAQAMHLEINHIIQGATMPVWQPKPMSPEWEKEAEHKAAHATHPAISLTEQNKALLLAAAQGDLAQIEQAIGHGADVNYQEDTSTPLSFAVAKQHTEVARTLIDRGARIRAVDFINAQNNLELLTLLAEKAPAHTLSAVLDATRPEGKLATFIRDFIRRKSFAR